MLQRDVPQDVDEMLFKVSENWGTLHDDKKIYTIYLIQVAPDGKDLLIQAENLGHKKIGKSWSQTLGRPVQQDVWHQ